MTLSLDTAYRSFGGEVEASSTPTICRLSDSRRHQLSAIARRADRTGPVDESRTIRRHDHVAGVEVGMAQPVPRPQALDQGEDARGDVLRNSGAGEPQRAVHQVAQK